MAKVLLGITVVFLVLSAILGFLNKNSLDAKTAQLESVQGQIDAGAAALDKAKAAQQEAETALADEVTKRESAEKDLSTAKKTADSASAKVAGLEADIKTKADKIAKLTEEAGKKPEAVVDAGVTEKVATLEAEKVELETSLAAAEKEMVLLAEKFQVEQAAAQRLRDAESNRQGALMAKGLEGRVLAYNPAWNFVVINIGDRQGVVGNAQMVVKRGSSMIGKIRISSVEPSSSIADVVPASMQQGLQIQPGDTVVYPGS